MNNRGQDFSIYEPWSKEQDPILNALVIFDEDRADTNGTMMQRVRDALATKVPIFCPISILQGSFINCTFKYFSSEVSSALAEIEQLLKTEVENWDFLIDRSQGTELAIIPKSYFGSYTLKDKLKLLGINPDKVEKVGVEKLRDSKHHSQTCLDAFLSFFIPDSKTKFRLFLAGHGGAHDAIAGLRVQNYQRFLEFFNQLRCEALFVQSCYAGGANRKYHKAVNFPVVLFSLGNFVTKYQRKDYKEFFKRIDQALLPQAEITTVLFSQALQKGEWIKAWQNLAQVCLPGKRDFELINEDGSALVLNDSSYSKQKICASKIRLLAISTTLFSTPIEAGDSSPLILSTRLKNPTHVIAHLSSQLSLDKFFDTTREYLLTAEGHVQKVIFERLECGDEVYGQVALLRSSGRWQLLAHDIKKDRYHHYPYWELWGADCPLEVSKEQYDASLNAEI